MKKSALILFLTLLPFMAKAQNTQNSEDGKKIDKEKLESKDYLPEIHGTIRGKYEYQTTMGAGRFEVRTHVSALPAMSCRLLPTKPK